LIARECIHSETRGVRFDSLTDSLTHAQRHRCKEKDGQETVAGERVERLALAPHDTGFRCMLYFVCRVISNAADNAVVIRRIFLLCDVFFLSITGLFCRYRRSRR